MFAASPSPAGSRDALARLGWQDFEHLLSEYYRDQGYRVEHAAPAPSLKALGNGIDLRLRRGGDSLIVQCKHWDASEVDAPEVSELLSTMLHEASTGGVLVTRGRFSNPAQAIARRQPRLQLVDGDLLRAMLKLPDHGEVRAPGTSTAALRTPSPARRRAASTGSSRLLPVGLGAIILLLIGVFAWRMSHPRMPVAPDAPPEASAPAKADPVVDAPRPAAPPVRPASAIDPAEDASRELAARARLRPSAAPRRDTAPPADDAIKVMERNTREVGASR